MKSQQNRNKKNNYNYYYIEYLFTNVKASAFGQMNMEITLIVFKRLCPSHACTTE